MNTIIASIKDIDSGILPHVEKRSHSNSIVFGVLLLLAAVVLLLSPMFLDNSTLSYAMIFIGIVLIVIGLYKIFCQSKCLYYSDTKSMIRRHDFYYEAEDFSSVKAAFEGQNVEGLSKLKCHDDGNVKVRAMFSKDCQYAAVQIFRYVPFDYKPESDVMVWCGSDAERFIKAIHH